MERKYYVYILGNYQRTVLYIGITNDLCKRVWEHKQEKVAGFTKRYHLHDLLSYEIFNDSLSLYRTGKTTKKMGQKKEECLNNEN